jgi:hypothetical protein
MEYVAGPNLARVLGGAPQPARPSAQLVEVLARAVHAVHRCGIIHRGDQRAAAAVARNDLLLAASLAEEVPAAVNAEAPPLPCWPVAIQSIPLHNRVYVFPEGR